MNFIDVATRNDLTTDVAKTNLKLLCNVLTGALLRETQTFVLNRRRGIPEESFDGADIVPNIDTMPQDPEDTQLADENREEQGFTINSRYEVMCALNGLRHYVYNDLFRFVDIPTSAKALYKEPKKVGGPVNYDTPMSAERFLNYKINNAAKVNEAEYKAACIESPNSDPIEVRKIFVAAALKRKAQIEEIKEDILAEVFSLPDVTHDTDGFKTTDSSSFDALPMKMQVSIATGLVNKLQQEHDRVLPIRTEKMATYRSDLRMEIEHLTKACDELVVRLRSMDD